MSNEVKEVLKQAHFAFYDLPNKTSNMYDTMEELAEFAFHMKEVGVEHLTHLGRKFYSAYANSAKTDDQKVALSRLLDIII